MEVGSTQWLSNRPLTNPASNREKETHMKRPKRIFTATILGALLLVSACSSSTTPTTSADSEAPAAPEPTSAPETTSAPDTTSAPNTTAAPADSGSESSSTTDSAMIWAIVLLGVLLLGLVIWMASRSGAKRGAAQHQQEQDAAAYRAEHPPSTGSDFDEPPSTPN